MVCVWYFDRFQELKIIFKKSRNEIYAKIKYFYGFLVDRKH